MVVKFTPPPPTPLPQLTFIPNSILTSSEGRHLSSTSGLSAFIEGLHGPKRILVLAADEAVSSRANRH